MSDTIILHEFKNGHPVRVFRPWEVRALVRSIPKNEYKDKFEALLYTGCRYTELRWLFKNPNRYTGEHIKIKNTKARVHDAYRWVHLNRQGQRTIENFLRGSKNLPTYQTWDENLKRWCDLANLDPTGVCAKSTRKTWESWLVLTYPTRIEEIFLSQGHLQTTALKHYLTFPFTTKDREDMLYYIEGW